MKKASLPQIDEQNFLERFANLAKGYGMAPVSREKALWLLDRALCFTDNKYESAMLILNKFLFSHSREFDKMKNASIEKMLHELSQTGLPDFKIANTPYTVPLATKAGSSHAKNVIKQHDCDEGNYGCVRTR